MVEGLSWTVELDGKKFCFAMNWKIQYCDCKSLSLNPFELAEFISPNWSHLC